MLQFVREGLGVALVPSWVSHIATPDLGFRPYWPGSEPIELQVAIRSSDDNAPAGQLCHLVLASATKRGPRQVKPRFVPAQSGSPDSEVPGNRCGLKVASDLADPKVANPFLMRGRMISAWKVECFAIAPAFLRLSPCQPLPSLPIPCRERRPDLPVPTSDPHPIRRATS